MTMTTRFATGLLVAWAMFAAVGCKGSSGAGAAGARACTRMVALCNGDANDQRECEQSLAEMRGATDGEENVAHVDRCVASAASCGEASGCVAGGAMRSGASVLRDFTRGLTR